LHSWGRVRVISRPSWRRQTCSYTLSWTPSPCRAYPRSQCSGENTGGGGLWRS